MTAYYVTIVAHYVVETDDRDSLLNYTVPEFENCDVDRVWYDGGSITTEVFGVADTERVVRVGVIE